MKKSFLMMAIIAMTLTMFSCKKDDSIAIVEEDAFELEGTWVIKNINFTTDNALWDEEKEPEYNGRTIHNYAPFMFMPMNGIEFTTTDLIIENEDGTETKYLGKILKFISKRTEPVFRAEYFENPESFNQPAWWYWNYSEDKESFSTESLSKVPSPCYAVHNVSNIVIENNGNLLKFDATVPSKILGQAVEYQDLPVEITLQRGSRADIGNESIVTILGEVFDRMP